MGSDARVVVVVAVVVAVVVVVVVVVGRVGISQSFLNFLIANIRELSTIFRAFTILFVLTVFPPPIHSVVVVVVVALNHVMGVLPLPL